jgi:hypothetical protein
VLLVWIPWRYVYWRPRILPASSIQLVFAGVKLLLMYLLAQLAWALCLWTAARQVPVVTTTPLAPVADMSATSGTV